MKISIDFAGTHRGSTRAILDKVRSVVTTDRHYTVVFYDGNYVMFCKNNVKRVTERG